MSGLIFYTLEDDDDLCMGFLIDEADPTTAKHSFTGFTVSDVQAQMRREVGSAIAKRVGFVGHPSEHQATAEHWRGMQEGLQASRNVAPEPPAQSSLAQSRESQAREHLCTVCVHRSMCVVSLAVEKLASLHPAVTTCGGFEPPPPRDAEEFAERIDGMTGGS